MNKLSQFNKDELHTIATSLGNTVNRLQEKQYNSAKLGQLGLAAYYQRCINDALAILEECEMAFNDLS